MTWNLAEAKNRLTEVVNLALTEGPQTITRRNDTVVMLSATEYAVLTGKRPGFKEYLTQGESFEGLELSRDQSPIRDVEL
jgi:antitoxin Phd